MPDNETPIFNTEIRNQVSQFEYPFLTAHLPGIGGKLKVQTADFIVEEIPLYEPGGEGEHLYLWIEKEDISGPYLTQHLSRTLGIPARDIGMAGLKDRRAITRQYVSVPASVEDRISSVDTDSIRVLTTKRHTNKLKTAHLKGNRFSILVRETAQGSEQQARGIADCLLRKSLPNYFGPQRFGREGSTLERGLSILQKGNPKAMRGSQVRLALSAVQSWLFNNVLQQRLRYDLFQTVLPGDVMLVRQSGGPFIAEDVEVEQQRFDQQETVLSGPLFGPKMKTPIAEAGQREEHVLQQYQLARKAFEPMRRFCPGARRALNLWLKELSIQPEADGLRFEFELPPGSYATVVMREIMKNPDQEITN